MNSKQQEKVPRWTWKIAWLLLIVGILVIVSGYLPKSFPSWMSSWSTRADYDTCHLSTGDNQIEILLEPNWSLCQTHITLESNQQSRWIVTPVGSTARIDRDFDSKIRFPGSDWIKRPNNTFKDHGIKRGVFQIQNLGEKKGDVVITVER